MKRFRWWPRPAPVSRLEPTTDNVVVRFPSAMLARIQATTAEEAQARYARLFPSTDAPTSPAGPERGERYACK